MQIARPAGTISAGVLAARDTVAQRHRVRLGAAQIAHRRHAGFEREARR